MIKRVGRYLRQHHLALLSLFLVLGGGSAYAAATVLPANSVGARQLKKNAVLTAKIKNNAVNGAKVANNSLGGADILESALGKVPAATNADHTTSADNATSATNATNATSATNATHATTADQLGGVSAAQYVRATLASGQTETGIYSAGGGPASGTGFAIGTISFLPKLPAAVPLANIHYLGTGGVGSDSHCPGAGQAAAGHLCFYEGWSFGTSWGGMADPASANAPPQPANPLGGALYFNSTNIQGNVRGTWAYQAP